MKGDFKNTIQTEREKLNQMIDDSLSRHIPLSQNESIQKQSKLLEELIEQANQNE